MIYCYQIPNKPKAKLLCEAFAQGCGGAVCWTIPDRLLDGGAMFYGVRPAVAHLWEQAKAEGRDWYYADNSYWDADRETYFRVAKNETQYTYDRIRGHDERTGCAARERRVPRWHPWRKFGLHIVLACQSDEFMQVVAKRPNWTTETLTTLRRHTDRPITVRRKGEKTSLAEALKDAWALVTYSSAAANEALLAGVPVFTDSYCAAAVMGCVDLSKIEAPSYPDGREGWAAALCARQWTIQQIARGEAWRTLTRDE